MSTQYPSWILKAQQLLAVMFFLSSYRTSAFLSVAIASISDVRTLLSEASHSQTVNTFHPSFLSIFFIDLSRSTFCLNLFFQNSTRDLGLYANLHPACMCQKQP